MSADLAVDFLAVDWGTTNLRAWVVDGAGKAVRRADFPLGVGRLGPGEAAARFADTVRPALDAQSLPAILCGMIGSNLGWQAAPYLDTPADAQALARALVRVDAGGPPTWIAPGLRTRRPDGAPDVMRGEETHVFGWASQAPDRMRGEHLICQPGTHAKWVRLVDGRVERFVTAMTGELFDLLSRHSVLSVLSVQDADEDEAAFDLGVAAAGDGGALASRLFTARSRVVGGDMPPSHARSYLSGLLVGADVASTPALLGVPPQARVAILGDPGQGARYRRALLAHGARADLFDGEAAVLAGLATLMTAARASC